MYVKAVLAAAICAAAATAQNIDRVFPLRYTETVQDVQEIGTVLRSVGDITNIHAEGPGKSIAMQATAGQIALSEWLIDEVDQPSTRQGLPEQGPNPAVHEYRVGTDADDFVRVFRLAHTPTTQQLQEVATLVRSIAEIRRVITYNSPRIVVLRGTASQMSMAGWLFNQLDRHAQDSTVREYTVPEQADDVIRVLHVSYATTVQDLQEVGTLLRSIGEIRRLFTYSEPRVIALRGTALQVKLADWLVTNLHSGAQNTLQNFPLAADDSVRLFRVSNARTVQDFQEAATLVRAIAEIPRVFTYNRPKIVAARGTSAQLDLAGWLFEEVDNPRPAEPVSREYHLRGEGDDIVRVFRVRDAQSTQALQTTAVHVRSTTGIRRVFTYNTPRIIALRGTAEQVEKASHLLSAR